MHVSYFPVSEEIRMKRKTVYQAHEDLVLIGAP